MGLHSLWNHLESFPSISMSDRTAGNEIRFTPDYLALGIAKNFCCTTCLNLEATVTSHFTRHWNEIMIVFDNAISGKT